MTALAIDTAKWVEEGKLDRTTIGRESIGCDIAQCIPPVFDSYCKIFHPFEVDPDDSDTLETRSEPGQQQTLTLDDILERRDEWLKEHKSKRWTFTSWKTIADKYGLIFHNQISPKTFERKFQKVGWQRNLHFPDEGHLPRHLLQKVLNILKLQSGPDEVFIYQAAPHTTWKDNKAEDLVKCKFEEVASYFSTDFIGYLYAEDKSWIMFTDADLTFTIVGGQRKVIDNILNSDLEAIECTTSTRVDDFSDGIN